MSLFEQFLIIAAVICTFSGCTAISMDRAVEGKTVSAVSDSEYADSTSNVRSTIYFGYDKYDLTDSAVSEIRSLSKSVKGSSSKVRIEGHCDERGTREYNLALGERRANAVREYLSSMGIAPDRLNVVSYGKERPDVEGSFDDAWQKNRRSVTTLDVDR